MIPTAARHEFDPRRVANFQAASKGLGGVVALSGLLVVAGWIFNIAALKSVLPGLATMKANTAVALLLCGIGLWLLQDERANPAVRRIARACAAVAAVVSLFTLSEYVFGWELGIDQLLFQDLVASPGALYPGRMSPMSALTLFLLGAALLLIAESGWRNRAAESLALLAILLSFVALLGYAYGVSSLYQIGAYSSMALHTAAGCALLGLGILLARPKSGVMAVLASNSAGGAMMRQLVPAAILIPPLLGWLRLQGQERGYYDTAFGTAWYAAANVLTFSFLMWWSGRSLHREDVERKRAEEEINRLFTLSRDLLCVAGSDGYFKRLNPAWEKTLGFTVAELLERPWIEFLHPDDRKASLAERDKLGAGAVTNSFENRYRSKDGSYKWLTWNAYPIPEEGLIYAAARDATDRKMVEDQIRRLNAALERQVSELHATNKELEAFTYSVSHDLRAPLRHIDGFSRILEEECGAQLDAGARRHLQRIRQGTRQMGELVDDLLSLSHVSRQEIRRQTTGLNSLVEEVRADLQEAAAQRGVTRKVEWRIARLPFADCDPVLMKQVFANLLSNAVKYSRPREHAVIEVGVTSQNGETVLFVRDNGVGFSMKYADKLFGVFQRLHRQEDFEGTGVGLATVQRIIQKHGGRIWVEAELDRGACFYFTIDAPASSLAAAPAPQAAMAGGNS